MKAGVGDVSLGNLSPLCYTGSILILWTLFSCDFLHGIGLGGSLDAAAEECVPGSFFWRERSILEGAVAPLEEPKSPEQAL